MVSRFPTLFIPFYKDDSSFVSKWPIRDKINIGKCNLYVIGVSSIVQKEMSTQINFCASKSRISFWPFVLPLRIHEFLFFLVMEN